MLNLSRLVFVFFAISLLNLNIVSAEVTENTIPKATFTLIKNNPDGKSFDAEIKLTHLPTANWQLAFSFVRPILKLDTVNIVKINQQQIGDFYIVKPNKPTNGNLTIHLTAQWFIKHETDAPSGYFLIVNPDSKKPTILPVKAGMTPLAKVAIDEFANNNKKNNTSIEGNPITSPLTPKTSLIVPLPAKLQTNTGEFVLNNKTVIVIENNGQASAGFLLNAIRPATGFFPPIVNRSQTKNLQNTILFTTTGANAQLGKEGYTLDVTPNNIVIRATDEAGFFYAVQSLLQLLPAEIYSKQFPNHPVVWKMPAVSITDYPRFPYRGLHLDVARHFQSVKTVKRLLDLMAIHKLNYFEWHLTDDEGWRIEIPDYPELTSKGAWRGFNPTNSDQAHALFPAFGSGQKPYGGYYTLSQIDDIVNYATERHITIIPEIDMPGHARALIMSLPTLLIDTQDASTYTSIQGYHDNVLSPCIDSTYTVIDDILNTVSKHFPGNYIHIGGDEVPVGVWDPTKSPNCKAIMDKQGFTQASQLEDYFLNRVQTLVKKYNKTMAGWEEIAPRTGTLKNPLLVYIWNKEKTDQVYQKAVENHYQIIMSPAENLYFDLAYSADPEEPGQYWAGFVDTFAAYSFAPVLNSQSMDIIKGVQGGLWGEHLNSAKDLDYLGFPKIAALAEVAWTPKERRNWINFSERMGYLHLPRLDYFGVNYRLSLPGILLSNNLLNMNVEFPGLALRYTQDGSQPNPFSQLYTGPTAVQSAEIKARSFNNLGRGSRVTQS